MSQRKTRAKVWPRVWSPRRKKEKDWTRTVFYLSSAPFWTSQLIFVTKNTVDNAMFGLKTCTKVSTRDPKCLKRHFWISGTVFFFKSRVSELRSARPNFGTLYYFIIYCWSYGRVGLSSDSFGVLKKKSRFVKEIYIFICTKTSKMVT
jgi:hypothetical protein